MPRHERTFDLHSLTHEVATATHEVASESFRLRAYRLIRKILIGFIIISLVNLAFSYFFLTPKMLRIHRDNQELIVRYRILQDKIRTTERRLGEIRHRDDYVYRSLFSADTLSMPAIWTRYPETKYAPLAGYDYSFLMTETWQQLDALARQLYRESLSFDELQVLSQNKEKLSAAIPAIWPIDRSKLHNNQLGAFNPRRYHPILKRIRPHNGVDFGCDRGTPVYASGDAVVEIAATGYNGGFGHMILLNHEFGYKTRYAHLNKILVQRGDSVVRGQIIGEVGNTGRSTGPHLHYEVIFRGRPVNPINYFNRNMTNEEYDRLMEQMRDTNYEL